MIAEYFSKEQLTRNLSTTLLVSKYQRNNFHYFQTIGTTETLLEILSEHTSGESTGSPAYIVKHKDTGSFLHMCVLCLLYAPSVPTIDLYTRLRAQAEQLKPEPKDRDRCEVSLSLSHSWKSGGHARGGEVDRREHLEYFPIQFYIHNNF